MKEQIIQLLGAAAAAGVTAAVVAVVALLRARVKNKLVLAMLDAVVKGVEKGDDPETKAAIATESRATGVDEHLDAHVQKTTGGAA